MSLSSRSGGDLTPMMRQYRALKDQHPHAILLFRLGDFFEAFFEDAHVVAHELQLTLTSRPVAKARRIPMCGIPHHALGTYLRRLIDRGHHVAICEQVEDPPALRGQARESSKAGRRQPNTLVRREIIRVVTPGTVIEDDLLTARENNYLAAIAPSGDAWGLALADLSTGEFFATEGTALQPLAEALALWRPREVLVPKDADLQVMEDIPATPYDARRFDPVTSTRVLRDQFGVVTLDAFGLPDAPHAATAAGALIQYLRDTQKGPLPHLRGIRLVSSSDGGLVIDDATRRALGVWPQAREGTTQRTLLDAIDLTETPMGGRLLRRWLSRPLTSLDEIEVRQDAVEVFVAHGAVREAFRMRLRTFGDLERLTGRLAHDAGSPRDLAALRDTLESLPGVIPLIERLTPAGLAGLPPADPVGLPPAGLAGLTPAGLAGLPPADAVGLPSAVGTLIPALTPPPGLAETLRRALVDAPPLASKDGGIFRPGYDPELDSVRAGSHAAREWMAGLEATERGRTGIRSLRVGYNQVVGYYIEVSKANAHLVPPDYIRKGTLVGAERYITAEMKERETLILTAQERGNAREYEVFCALREAVRRATPALQAAGRALAELDVYAALAEVAVRHRYVRPRVTEDRALRIVAGRHPVVEQALGPERFVPNDLTLAADSLPRHTASGRHPERVGGATNRDILIVTGPNFGGKSTYIRQAALIVILAQMGGFVPAQEAEIGLVDRIFTRVGATDDLTAARSTFLSEMIEVARILTQATPRSLVILDEVGRGTSTYDGMSLAWAVVEDLHDRVGSRTLFATHYHELTELASQLERVQNAQVLVREDGQNIIFLHRVADGAAESSYGIHVARLAGVPEPVIRRAREVLDALERSGTQLKSPRRRRGPSRSQQLALPLPSPVEDALRQIDLATMTPLDALNFLSSLRALLDAPVPSASTDLPASGGSAGGTVVPFPRPPGSSHS